MSTRPIVIYGGLDSELLSGYPMASESKLPLTLHDFIHDYGTMEGLKSDNAKSETLFKMKDLFRIYMINRNKKSHMDEKKHHPKEKQQQQQTCPQPSQSCPSPWTRIQ